MSNQKKKSNGRQDGGFMFFVPDQGEGAAKVIVILLKVLMLIGTTILCLCFGILGPICIWIGEYDPAVTGNPAIVTWLVTSIVYIIGTFVIMLGHSRIASIIDCAASVGSLLPVRHPRAGPGAERRPDHALYAGYNPDGACSSHRNAHQYPEVGGEAGDKGAGEGSVDTLRRGRRQLTTTN